MGRLMGWVVAAAVGLLASWAFGAAQGVVAGGEVAEPTADVVAGEAGARQGEESWYVVRIAGERAGHAVMGWREEERGGQEGGARVIATTSEMRFSIRRGETVVSMVMTSRFVETVGGEAVEMESVQALGAEPIRRVWRFLDGGVAAEATQGGRTTRTREARPGGGWVTPRVADRLVRERVSGGEEPGTVVSMDPSLGLRVVSTTRVVEGREEREGRVLVRTRVTTDAMPGVASVEWLDETGELVRSETDLGGLSLVMERTTREEALAEGAKGAAGVPEVMVATFVKPSRRIEQPGEVLEGEYVLRMRVGRMPEVPTTGSQEVERVGEDAAAVRVRVLRDGREGAGGDGIDAGEEGSAWLGVSRVIDPQDPAVVRLAERVGRVVDAGEGRTREGRARIEGMVSRAHAVVHRHMGRASLGVGLGTAGEAARTGAGDCTEYAVLLAAVLRNRGIGARVASGLVYAEEFAGEREVFVYHMWTQARVPGETGWAWRDVDATRNGGSGGRAGNGEGPGAGSGFTATHIALSVSALGEGEEVSAMAGVATLLGRLEVEVIQTRAR